MFSKHINNRKLSLVIAVAMFVFCFGRIIDFQWIPKGHDHELFHYTLGVKYFKDLGYSGLYDASLLALSELKEDKPSFSVRNLKNKETYKTYMESISDGQKYKDNMGDLKWEIFRQDVNFFDVIFEGSEDGWDDVLVDHGFNPSPIWNIYGGLLFSTFDLKDIYPFIPLVDLLILVICSLVLTAALSSDKRLFFFLFFWLFLAFFPGKVFYLKYWVIGSYLRFSWFLWLSLGIYFLNKSQLFIAAFFLTTAALERVFPGAFVFATGFWLFVKSMNDLKMKKVPDYKLLMKYLSGVLVALSFWGGLFLSEYSLVTVQDFSSHITHHNQVYGANNLGYKQMLAYSNYLNTSRPWSIDGYQFNQLNNQEMSFMNLARDNRVKSNYLGLIVCLGTFLLSVYLIPRKFGLCVSTMFLGFVIIFLFSAPAHYYFVFLILLVWSVLGKEEATCPIRFILYIFVGLLLGIGITHMIVWKSIFQLSVILSSLFFILIILLLSCGSEKKIWPMLGGSSALLYTALVYYNNTLDSNVNIPPLDNVKSLLNVSGGELSGGSQPVMEAAYTDIYGRQYRESGLILRSGDSMAIPFVLDKSPGKDLIFIIRSDFNYEASTFLTVNRNYTRGYSSPEVGGMFVYLQLPVDSRWLHQGVNEIQFGLTDAPGFAVYHLWLVEEI